MRDEKPNYVNIAEYSSLAADREIWMDALKIVACVGVVLCHSVYAYNTTDNESRWFLALCINSLARFGVPCFMLVSSVLILRKADDINKIRRVRIPRLAIKLIFWAVVYILWKKFGKGEDLNVMTEILTIPFALFYCFKDKFAALDERKRSAIVAMSKLTMGVYFIHPIIQDLSRKVFDIIVHDKMGHANSWDILVRYPLTDLVFCIGVFVISLGVCWVLAKIPYLRKVII
jgi:surface polysaccharide O-acyltransferase-like enzyme